MNFHRLQQNYHRDFKGVNNLFYIVLLLSVIGTFSYYTTPVETALTNNGITWFPNSNSKIYTPILNSWEDVDVSADSDIPDGASGLVLEIVNKNTITPYIGQVRAKGSNDNRISGAKIGHSTQIMAFVKIDVNKQFQAYRTHEDIKFYIKGYTGENITLFTEWSDVAGGHQLRKWYTVNLSSYGIPGNSIIILELYDHTSSSSSDLRFRQHGRSSFAVYGQAGTEGAHQFIMVGVDENSRFQHRIQNNDYKSFNLVGYIENVGNWKHSPSDDVSGSITGVWTDIDITNKTSNNAKIVLFYVTCGPVSDQPKKADFRFKDSQDDQYNFSEHWYKNPSSSIFYLVGLDDDQIFQIKIESSALNIHILGYLTVNLPPNAPKNLLCEGQMNPSDITTVNPTFSWVFDDPNVGDGQSARRIQVTTESNGNGVVLWDSGKQMGADSSDVYEGAALSRGVTYHWQVKTWDNHDAEGSYSSDQIFQINQLPVTSDLRTEGEINPEGITTLTPTFSWIYNDGNGDLQSHWEIEVGSARDGHDMWDFIGVGADTSDEYEGNALSRGVSYHVRVRVKDGKEWSTWGYGTFKIDNIPHAPTDLLCEGQVNPIELTTMTPTFSWTFSDPDTGDSQGAWRIQVSTEADGGGVVLWNSGKQMGADSNDVYEGAALSRGVTYHWQVKTWDNHDVEGPYCSDQIFQINQLPTVLHLKTEDQLNPEGITTFTPSFKWAYSDLDGNPQSHFEIEVGTYPYNNDMWKLKGVTGTDTSFIYEGNPLSKGVVYNVQVRVKDGKEWGDWTIGTFKIRDAISVKLNPGSNLCILSSDEGIMEDVFTLDERNLPTEGKPPLIFPYGFLSFHIDDFSPGAAITITMEMYENITINSQFWGYCESGGGWIRIPMGSNDGDYKISITIVDGGICDADGEVNGRIEIFGGLGIEVILENYPTIFNGRTLAPSVGSSKRHGPFNEGAKTSDVLAVVDICIGFSDFPMINLESGRLDTEQLTWPGLRLKSDYKMYDYISTGGPIVNLLHYKYNDPTFVKAWWDSNTWEIVTSTGGRYSDVGGRHCHISIIYDDEQIIMLGSGYSAEATRDVGIILRDYRSYPLLLQGSSCVFIPEDLNSDGDFLDSDELQILENLP